MKRMVSNTLLNTLVLIGIALLLTNSVRCQTSIKTNETHVKAGKKVYHKTCWACHGRQGSGNGPGSFHLKEKPANFKSEYIQSQTNAQLTDKILNGFGEMRAYKEDLSKVDIENVVFYIRSLSDKKD